MPVDAAVRRPCASTVMFAVVYEPATTPVAVKLAESSTPLSMFTPVARPSTNVLTAVKLLLTSPASATVPLVNDKVL